MSQTPFALTKHRDTETQRFLTFLPLCLCASVFCVGVLSLARPAAAQINMPDPSMIAGRALPAPELPNGTVSVRVVRESIGNNITGQQVSVTAGGTTKTGTTDENGRAQMTGLPSGAQGTA